jgi:DNA repair exonuclease SbcCD ATPase subunit
MKVLLSNVDEPVFNNVFAVGLTEIQELATLSDTEAAELLYSLSAGLDRVSLVEVLRELANSRNRLLDASGGSSQVTQLLEEQEKIRADIEELGSINRRWGHLAAERDQLHREITQWEEDAHRTENAARAIDLALSLRDRWAQRAALDEQLSLLGPMKAMPEDAVERLNALNARIQKHEQRLDQLAQEREGAKREFSTLAINEALWRQAARIEAFKEQEPWIAQLQGQIGQLQSEIAASESELAAEYDSLGLKSDGKATGQWPVAGGQWPVSCNPPSALRLLPSSNPQSLIPNPSPVSPHPNPLPWGEGTLSPKTLAAFRSPAKQLHQCRGRLREAKQAAATARQTADALTAQIESALTARGEKDLTTAMDRAGGLVSQLRRRVQLDERLDQLARYQIELEERSRTLVDRQLLPMGVLIGLGAVIVAGIVLVLAGLFMPTSITGSIGWGLVVLGLASTGIGAFSKVMLERSNAHQLDSCQKQLGVLQLQIEQAKKDRDQLDAQLPRGGGAIAGRLQAAESELAGFEELTPLDTRRNAARQEVEAAQRRVDEAKEELRLSRRRWRKALAAIGLPEELDPTQVRRLSQRGGRIGEIQRRLAQYQEDLSRRQRELESLSTRIVQLAAEAGVPLVAAGPVEQLRELAATSAQQQAGAARREALRVQARRIRIKRAKHEEAIVALKHHRRELFLEAGVKDEQAFRKQALDGARADVLQRQRDELSRDIQTALASHCSEDAIRQHLEGRQDVPLENRRDELRQRLTIIEQQLHERLERRGRFGEQWAAMAADRQLANRHLDLAIVEKRLEDALCRWQVLAVTCCILDMIRTTYEQHRQPETLQEASGYLDRLTQGRYRRVWTPLGEHALRVDDAEGHSLPVEVLSRGTREQLFLSLRLALVSSYARRGAPLPLVLDDVLVNFDSERAKAAAGVLRDFAATGHQLLVLTCHEHILKLFKSLKAPVSRLPSNTEPGDITIAMEHHPEETPKRAPQERSTQRKAASKSKRESEPIVEEKEDEEHTEKPSKSKKRAAGSTFDADFFDSDDEAEEEIEEDDDSLWDDDGGDEEIEDLDDDNFAAA